MRSYLSEHYDENCKLERSPWESIWLFFTSHIFLWNIFISLHQSWCYSSWQSKLSKPLCLHSYSISSSNIFFLQKWHNKLTLTSVMAWWEKDNSDFPQKFAGSLKYGLRAQDHHLLLHKFQPKMSKLKSCQIHTIYLENFRIACTVHVTSWLIVFKPHFSNQVHKGVL